MDLWATERLLPVLGAALPAITQLGRAGRHALPELGREAVARGCRHPERLQALICESNGDPRILRGVGLCACGADYGQQPPDELPSCPSAVDAKEQIAPDIGRRTLV